MDQDGCFVTYIGKAAQSTSAAELQALKEALADGKANGPYLLQETGNLPVVLPAEVVIGFLAYLEQVALMTTLTQIVRPELSKYLDTVAATLLGYLFAQVPQDAFVRDCLDHGHDLPQTDLHITPSGDLRPDSSSLLASLGFSSAEIAGLNRIAADRQG